MHLASFLQSSTFVAVKRLRHIVLLLVILLLPLQAGAQGHIRRAMEKARERQEQMARREVANQAAPQGSAYMHFIVEDGDTTYLDKLPPIWILGRRNAKDERSWRAYYKLVWRFPRVYPYALASGRLIQKVDSTLNAEHYGVIRKDRYISALQKQLFKDFEGDFRNMSIQQGALMLKLINRETGITAYEIIKTYKNSLAAGFWQGVAKLFDNDLKSGYDPEGADRQLEELVQIWQRGEFPSLYWSVFWEDPPVVNVPESYLD